MAAPYAWLDEFVTSGHMARTSPAGVRVMLVLSAHMTRHQHEAWPAADRIGRMAGLSRAAVYAALSELCGAGLLSSQLVKRPGRYREYTITVYKLTSPIPPLSEAQGVQSWPQDTTPRVQSSPLDQKLYTSTENGHVPARVNGDEVPGNKATTPHNGQKEHWQTLVRQWRSASTPLSASPRPSLEMEALDLANRLQNFGLSIGALQVREFLEHDQEGAGG